MLEILPLNTTTSFSKEAIKNEKKQICRNNTLVAKMAFNLMGFLHTKECSKCKSLQFYPSMNYFTTK